MNNHTPLYTSQQIYQIEQNWFKQANPSFALMQQASWHMATWINDNFSTSTCVDSTCANSAHNPKHNAKHNPCIWAGHGNNGGDGWLLAYYLQQLGWQPTVIEVSEANTTDSKHAKKMAIESGIVSLAWQEDINQEYLVFSADIHIDALFGIGLDREPMGNYASAIAQINQLTAHIDKTALAVDIPSGLLSNTGEVFNDTAICADLTLCLLASKVGLFIKEGKDYAGKVVTLPLIPLPADEQLKPTAIKLTTPYQLPKRPANSHKGSYGHVLIIGGNKSDLANGMGGAGILSATGAFAVGAGKVSIACHSDYHSAVLAKKPSAMVVDLHHLEATKQMMSQTNVVAIGMGLGRDRQTTALFTSYLTQAMQNNCKLIIDADGLYHLAKISIDNPDCKLLAQLKSYADTQFVAFTPHTGEMARLLNISTNDVETNRIHAIEQAKARFGGCWLLKGAASIVAEDEQIYVCDVGNAGMATAGMGDVLSGVLAGLQAQVSLSNDQKSLRQAVLLHGLAGDDLAQAVGEYAVQADNMSVAIESIINLSTF